MFNHNRVYTHRAFIDINTHAYICGQCHCHSLTIWRSHHKYVLYVFIAVQRWILKAHDRAKILQTCREMAGMYDAAIKHHKDASAPRMKKGENVVHKSLHTIESCVNPFKSRNATEPLVNIASAVKATDGKQTTYALQRRRAMLPSSVLWRRDWSQMKSTTCMLHYQNPTCRRSEI